MEEYNRPADLGWTKIEPAKYIQNVDVGLAGAIIYYVYGAVYNKTIWRLQFGEVMNRKL